MLPLSYCATCSSAVFIVFQPRARHAVPLRDAAGAEPPRAYGDSPRCLSRLAVGCYTPPVRRQTTIVRRVVIEGVGIHTGRPVQMRVEPAEADSGVVFVSGDGRQAPADLNYVSDTDRHTALSAGGAQVRTVEHFLAACYGLQVDNARVRLDSDELPAGDGSASHFVAQLRRAGKRRLTAPRQQIVVKEPAWVGDGSRFLTALPLDRTVGLRACVALHYEHPLVDAQVCDTWVNARTFAEELAPARTFGLAEEGERLRSQGYALGASEENVLVIYPDRISSPLRFPNELARHKVLDLVGDLALLGADVVGFFLGFRSGHYLHVQLAKALRKRYLGR